MDMDLVLALATDSLDFFDEDKGPQYLGVSVKEGDDDAMVLVPVNYFSGPKEEIRKELHVLVDQIIDEVIEEDK